MWMKVAVALLLAGLMAAQPVRYAQAAGQEKKSKSQPAAKKPLFEGPQSLEDLLVGADTNEDNMVNRDEFVAQIDKVLARFPNNPVAHYEQGLVNMLENRFEEAAESFRASLRALPNFIDAHFNLGSVLTVLGRGAEAEAEFMWVIEHDPQDPQAHLKLGIVYFTIFKDYDKAIRSFHEALRIAPNYHQARYNAAMAYEAKKDLRNALKEFERLVADMPPGESLDIEGVTVDSLIDHILELREKAGR